MNIQIEKGIPIPSPRSNRSGLSKKLRELGIGDSIFLEERTLRNTSGLVCGVQRKTGMKFTSRGIDGGVRIWRTA